MKLSEIHRSIKRNGWRLLYAESNHYIYEKDGISYPVPFDGAKEIGEGLRRKIVKEMKLIK